MRKLLLLAAFLLISIASPARAQFCPGVSPWVFDDVAASDPFCGYITWMAENGITLGCVTIDANHRLYCPNANVTRAAMAAFMNRLGNVRVEAVDTGPGLTGGPITSTGTINLATTQLLPTTACATNQIPKWNGTAWACANEASGTGTVTSVASGTGLTGGPITASGTLSIATGYQLPQGCTAWGQIPMWSEFIAPGLWVCVSPNNVSGNLNLQDSTSAANGNITKPGGRFIHNFGINGTFLGVNAGNFTTTGINNTGLGYVALNANTTGTENTAAGSVALPVNTTGSNNTAVGYVALANNTVGSFNTGVGRGALALNTTASGNTALGANALNLNTTGSENTATGAFALYPNTTGNQNSAFGSQALLSNTTGSFNTSVGSNSLLNNTTGTSNVAVGANTLASSTTGGANTAIGNGALGSNTTGQFNVAVGTSALSSSVAQDGNTAVGVNALSLTTTGFDNTSTGRQSLTSNTTGANNVAMGSQALTNNTGGNNNIGLGALTMLTNSVGFNNIAIGFLADVAGNNLSNAIAIGANALVDASNHVRIGNTAVTQIGGQVAWTNLSDRREKKDIRPVSLGLDFVLALKPVEYRMRNGNDRIDFGFLAQDVESLLGTGYNVLGIGGTAERKLSLRYTDFIAPMARAIQEQQALIERQQADIAQLRQAVEVLMARVASDRTLAAGPSTP